MAQKPPRRIDAPDSTNSKPATFIFLHGFGDDSDGWISETLPVPPAPPGLPPPVFAAILTLSTDIAQQFHSANKLPYLSWVFPNAPHNHEAMTNAWYTPTSFSPIPVGRSSENAVKEDDDDEFNEEAEDEILKSVEYVCGLIDEEVKRGIDLNRIIVGGFSQVWFTDPALMVFPQ